MSIRHRNTGAVVVLLLVFSLSACNSKKSDDGHLGGQATSTQISLSLGPNNACVQNGVEGGNAVMDTGGVTWVPPTAATSLSIVLKSCPFSGGCSNFSSSGASIPSGPSSVASGTVTGYQSITIGGTQCTVNNDGLIMK